jgi:hypothetical protein
MASRCDEGKCVLQPEAQSHVFKDQRGMHQGYRSETQTPLREVATVEFQAGDPAGPETPLDFAEVSWIDVHSDDPLCHCAVDLFQAIAACYAEYCDTLRKTVIESAFEQFR